MTPLIGTVNEALSRLHEFEELADKLAIFGLEPDDLCNAIEKRWAVNAQPIAIENEAPHQVFARGFTEGIISGIQVAQRERIR